MTQVKLSIGLPLAPHDQFCAMGISSERLRTPSRVQRPSPPPEGWSKPSLRLRTATWCSSCATTARRSLSFRASRASSKAA